MGSRIFECSPKAADDGLIAAAQLQNQLKRFGNLIAQESREPRLIVHFNQLHPAHGGFSRTAANSAGMEYNASKGWRSLLWAGGWGYRRANYPC
jgi:hypothetical protein